MTEPYDVIIVGAGLTGLSLAHNLTTAGVGTNFLVLEARDRIGGRIHTALSGDGAPVEMGATWFFPMFKNLFKAMKTINVELMPQYMKGYTFYDSGRGGKPRKVDQGEDGDMFRIKGGTGNLTSSLLAAIDSNRVLLNQIVNSISRLDSGFLEVATKDKTYRARKVVTTIPPQLLADSVTFKPDLPDEVQRVAQNTHTWMGDSMKGAVTYERPFWREAGLAGALYSNTGPFVQMYDQTSTDNDKFALVGFMDAANARLPPDQRKARVVEQLVRVFGPEAATPLDYRDTFWAEEEFTMPPNAARIFAHKNNGHNVYSRPYMGGALYIGGTETSRHAGGFMEGAVTSASDIAMWIIDDLK